jgi:hypothetical protein
MNGLDPPQKIAPTDPTGEKPAPMAVINLTRTPDAELIK